MDAKIFMWSLSHGHMWSSPFLIFLGHKAHYRFSHKNNNCSELTAITYVLPFLFFFFFFISFFVRGNGIWTIIMFIKNFNKCNWAISLLTHFFNPSNTWSITNRSSFRLCEFFLFLLDNFGNFCIFNLLPRFEPLTKNW